MEKIDMEGPVGRSRIYVAIENEREYQNGKWGDNPHEIPGWIMIMEEELREARQAWVEYGTSRRALEEVLQVIAVGVACLEQHGVYGRPSFAGRPVPLRPSPNVSNVLRNR